MWADWKVAEVAVERGKRAPGRVSVLHTLCLRPAPSGTALRAASCGRSTKGGARRGSAVLCRNPFGVRALHKMVIRGACVAFSVARRSTPEPVDDYGAIMVDDSENLLLVHRNRIPMWPWRD